MENEYNNIIEKQDNNEGNNANNKQVLTNYAEKQNISCYILYEYGVTKSYINTIIRSGYSLNEIKQNPEILDALFGEYRNKKLKEIINTIDNINRESVYELLKAGLSKAITDDLFKKNITIEILDKMEPNQLYEEYGIGKAACRKTYEALGKYKNKDYLTNYTAIFKDILLKYDKKNISLNEFYKKEEVIMLNLTKEQIYNELEKIEKQENIVIYEENIIIQHEYLLNAIEKYVKTDSKKNILRGVLKGKKQIEIASEKNLTRERVRQIFNKAFAELPKILEEDIVYKDIFTRYNIEEELFTKLFMTEKEVYYYLANKYEKGEESLIELLGTEFFDENEENIIKNYYKLIKYNDKIIKEDKMQLLLAILQTEGIQYNILELVDKYNKIIEENKYNLEKIDNIHNIEAALSRQKNVIVSNKRRYRYYNYKLLTQDDIQELRNLLDIDDGAYYTDYFFDKNRELMNKINILDKNELYNLMKTLFSNEENIKFSNMPIVLIGYDTKDDFFIEKMNNLSPISSDEFAEKISEEYGHNIDSLKSYLSKVYYSYITNGMINLEEKNFDDEQIEKIKATLTKDIYSIKELKEILHKLFDSDCTEYIKTVNFAKLGFKIREQYVFKINAGTIDTILAKEILQSSIFNLKETRLKNIGSSFLINLYNLISKNKLLKYDDGLYYTEKGLKELGIDVERIIEFKDYVHKNIKESQIFTIYNLEKLGICEKYADLNINKVFLESIIKTINGIKSVSIENNMVFIKTNDEYFNKADFIEKIILDNDLTKITDIQKFLNENYDIDIELSQIKELINLKKYNMEDVEDEKERLEVESIEEASDDYNIIMVLKYIEKIFGIGIQRNFTDDKNSEFLKRFDNTLNTLNQKEKKIVILKNGLKNGKSMTAEEVAEKMEIVSANTVGNIDRNVIDKLRNKERTRILRTYFNFSNNEFEDSTADFILDLLK